MIEQLVNIGGKKLLIQLNRSFEKKCSVNNLREIKIAIDAMGGDFGPSVVINGAYLALKKNPAKILDVVGLLVLKILHHMY